MIHALKASGIVFDHLTTHINYFSGYKMVFISPCDILAIAGVSGNPSELFARAATGLVRFVQKLGTSKLQWFIMVHHGSSWFIMVHHFFSLRTTTFGVCHGQYATV